MAISSLFPQLLWLLFAIYAQTSASKECDPAAIYLDVRTEDISYGEITIRPNRPRDQEVITAQSGQNVTLTCRAPNNNKNNIIVVEWSRPDLGEECVLMYRDEQSDPEHQHPSFKNRVDLQDRQMKDGDVSLILKNVTINDTGTYECRVVQRGNNRGKRAVLNNNPISVIYLRVDLPDKKIITAESGQNVTLTCQVLHNNIIIVEWSRADLKTEHVLVYRNGNFVPDDQHPSFKNRVDLQDRQMKDGDVSLILKDVTINDTGTYECRVFMEETQSWKLISIINMSVVDPPGQTGGHTEGGGKEDGGKEAVVGRGHFWLVAGLIFVAAVVGFLIYRAHQQQNQDSFQPPGEKQPCCYY